MTKYKRLLFSVAVAEGNCTHIDIDLYYNKGGMNYFTGSIERRGYYISIQPLTKGTNTYSYTAFTGVKQLVKEAGRYSAKTLNEFVIDYDLVNSLIEHIVQKNNLKLSLLNKNQFNISQSDYGMQTDVNSHTEEINISTQC